MRIAIVIVFAANLLHPVLSFAQQRARFTPVSYTHLTLPTIYSV